MTNDGTKTTMDPVGLSSSLDASSKIASDCSDYLQREEEQDASAAVPANIAWDPVSKQLWLGVSRSPHCDTSSSGERRRAKRKT